VPVGVVTQLFAIVVMLIGSAVFGATVSAFSFVLHQALNNDVEKMTNQLKNFMKRRAVPADLQWRVQENLRRRAIIVESAAMAPKIIANLSPILRRELCMSLLQATLTQFPFFRAAQRAFVVELAQAHAWEHVMHGDLVAEEGHTVADLVFVIEGCLQSFVPAFTGEGRLDMRVSRVVGKTGSSGSNSAKSLEIPFDLEESSQNTFESFHTIHVKMAAGAWFGEASLFDQERIFSTAVTGLEQSDLAVLSCYDYIDILKRYPWHQQQHEAISKELLAGTISLEALRYMEDALLDTGTNDPNADLVAKFFNLGSKGQNSSTAKISPCNSLPNLPVVPSGGALDTFDDFGACGDDESPCSPTASNSAPVSSIPRLGLSHVAENEEDKES